MASRNESELLNIGFDYPTVEITITEEVQADKLSCCNVDPGVHGGHVDITAYAMHSILAAKHAGFTINGSVHVAQHYDLREPINLGESVSLRGRVTAVEPHLKGTLLTSSFEVVRANGDVPLALSRTSLRMRQESEPKPSKSASNSSSAPVASDRDDLNFIASRQLEPQKVARYSSDADNLIHSDPKVAAQFGFSAPIAGGLMASRLMMETLARRGAIESLDMTIRFLRPMFWDLRLDVYADTEEKPGVTPARIEVRRPDGKIANEAAIAGITLHS